MKILTKFGRVQLALSLAALVLLPAAVFAQQQNQDQPTVTLQDVKDRLKQNEKFIKDAQSRGKAGDAAGTQVALDNYSRNMQGLDQALSRTGQFQGDESARVEALERVEKATRKHGEVLSNLLTKVPDQAKPAIEHAMQVSQHGRDTALGNLDQARSQRDAADARRNQAGQNSMGGRPDTAGNPGGVGQQGGMGGPMNGAGQPAGGRPSGTPGGRR